MDAPSVLGTVVGGVGSESMREVAGEDAGEIALLPRSRTTSLFVLQETLRGLGHQFALLRGSMVYHLGWHHRLELDPSAEAPLPEDMAPAQAEFDAWLIERWLPQSPVVSVRATPPPLPNFVSRSHEEDLLPHSRLDIEIEAATAGVGPDLTGEGEHVEHEDMAWPGPIGGVAAGAGAGEPEDVEMSFAEGGVDGKAGNAGEQEEVAGEQEEVAGEQEEVAGDRGQVAGDKEGAAQALLALASGVGSPPVGEAGGERDESDGEGEEKGSVEPEAGAGGRETGEVEGQEPEGAVGAEVAPEIGEECAGERAEEGLAPEGPTPVELPASE